MSYPNMSYCQCENTLLALRQVLGNIEEQGAEFLHDMSKEERRAFYELFHACESFVEQAGELTEDETLDCDGVRITRNED